MHQQNIKMCIAKEVAIVHQAIMQQQVVNMEMQSTRHQVVAAERTRGTQITLSSLTLVARSSYVEAVTAMGLMRECSISTFLMVLLTTATVSVWSCPYFDAT